MGVGGEIRFFYFYLKEDTLWDSGKKEEGLSHNHFEFLILEQVYFSGNVYSFEFLTVMRYFYSSSSGFDNYDNLIRLGRSFKLGICKE